MNKNKIMKAVKYITGVSVLTPLLIFTLLLMGRTGWKQIDIDNFRIYHHMWSGDTIVADYYWDGDENNMTVVIPDEVDGKKLDGLGGAVWEGQVMFNIEIPDDVRKNDEFNFTVKLGKNIKHAEHFYYSEQFRDEDYGIDFKVTCRYEVAEDNKWLYSKDGRLYDKKTDKPVGYIPEWQSQPL